MVEFDEVVAGGDVDVDGDIDVDVIVVVDADGRGGGWRRIVGIFFFFRSVELTGLKSLSSEKEKEKVSIRDKSSFWAGPLAVVKW